MMVTAVGSWERIESVLAEVSGLVRYPLLTMEPVRVCKRDGQFLGIRDRSPGTDEHGLPLGQKLTVYTSAAARYRGQPIHRALARRLLDAGIGGVTTLRGVWGFHGNHAPHGDSGLHLARHVPAVTVVIDTPERIPAGSPDRRSPGQLPAYLG
jgi:PII-like signaling protein